MKKIKSLFMTSFFGLLLLILGLRFFTFAQTYYASYRYTHDNYPPLSNLKYPIPQALRTCFLKNWITSPHISVGDYTYYDDPDGAHNFEKNVLYLFDFTGDKLIIGKFCQIATGVRFIMNGAQHDMHGFTTYPFKAFGHGWKDAAMKPIMKGNTIVGNDVWIGNNATIMPGVIIGNGAIIGTNSLVTKNVDPYTIVGGNPARVIRKRFDQETIDLLLKIAWWDWPVEKITEQLPVLLSGNLAELRKLSNSI